MTRSFRNLAPLVLGFVTCVLLPQSDVRAAQDDPVAAEVRVPKQPLLSQFRRLDEVLRRVGTPLPENVRSQFELIRGIDDAREVQRRVQELLDPFCLVQLDIQEDGTMQLERGQTAAELVEQGWRTFLIKVINRPGFTNRIRLESPNAASVPHSPASLVASRWMDVSTYEGQPMRPHLSGLPLEYRLIQIYSRDAGERQGRLVFSLGDYEDSAKPLIKRWEFENEPEGWFPMNDTEFKVENGHLQITTLGDDPFMGAEVSSEPADFELRFWAETELDGPAQVFWWTKDRPQPSGDRLKNFYLRPGKGEQYRIQFRTTTPLAGVRLDPGSRPGKVKIDWIDLVKSAPERKPAAIDLEFQSTTASKVTFRIRDEEGIPAFAKFEIRDAFGRVYPAQSKRLAPDFFFQPHIYRGDGETVSLPPGEYTVRCERGPETLPEIKQLRVGDGPAELTYTVRRWIDPSDLSWWSGDHHIHAAGCQHYENPTQGVNPEDMIRHIMGEDLKVGCCLTWGPCFDFQKRFFTGEVAEQSQYPYTLRYDVEVSGFGSHQSGHLNLLNLKEQIYPGGESKDHWPTLGLNTLRWAKAQGGICGPAHSGNGLTRIVGRLDDPELEDGPHRLPNYDIPAYDGIGANEFVMNVTHKVPGPDGELVPAIDFISAMDTARVAEWNMWYHVMNCGYRVVVSGETDFPCISGERVGMGRVYAKVDGRLTFDSWVQSIGKGRSYVSDGLVHLMDFGVQEPVSGTIASMGEQQTDLELGDDGRCRVTFLTGARVPGKEEVTAEILFNGYPIATQTIAANGEMQEISIDTQLEESGWLAVRVFPHAHTNPVHVRVGGKPMHPVKDSVRWCLAGVERCWMTKQPTYAAEEQEDARAAYDHARRAYKALLKVAEGGASNEEL